MKKFPSRNLGQNSKLPNSQLFVIVGNKMTRTHNYMTRLQKRTISPRGLRYMRRKKITSQARPRVHQDDAKPKQALSVDWMSKIRRIVRQDKSGQNQVSLCIQMFQESDIDLLSVSEVEKALSLFDSIRNAYMIRNFLVAKCAKPWNVDPHIGGSGVCYFGNLGTKPSSDGEKAKLLAMNKRMVKKRHCAFWSC